MRGRLSGLAALALVAACGLDGEAPGGPGLPGGPVPPPRGRGSAVTATAVIDAAGGTVSLAVGSQTLTVTVPTGALEGSATVTLEEISNTAPASVGSAFRVTASLPLAAPATLTFTVPALPPSEVTIASQGSTGYWFRTYEVSRDATTVSTQTRALGDFSLVSLATARDLHGPFRLDSTESVTFTATGDALLQWVGDDAGFAYYVTQGTIALATPLANGTASCAPDTPALQTMPWSTSEIRNIPTPVQFRWGINGRWDLTCSDGVRTSVSTDFDSLGITNVGCVRSYVGIPTITSTHVQGQYLIDCSATAGRYKIVASWDLVLPAATPGTLPPPPAPWP